MPNYFWMCNSNYIEIILKYCKEQTLVLYLNYYCIIEIKDLKENNRVVH